ncbi:hypothetical protein ACO0SA_001219 [Hanseniaspora valbyensis]
MPSEQYSINNQVDQLFSDKISKDLNKLTSLLIEKNKLQATLHLDITQKEELELKNLIHTIETELTSNNIPKTDTLYLKFENIMTQYQNNDAAPTDDLPVKKVRFDIEEQDKHLDDIHSKLKSNKQKIIQEIQPELLAHDGLINDLEQGFDKGLINLNKINHDSILPSWKRNGGRGSGEVQRAFIIGFLIICLFLLWLL